MADAPPAAGNRSDWIGAYSPEERKKRLAKYHAKRLRRLGRNWAIAPKKPAKSPKKKHKKREAYVGPNKKTRRQRGDETELVQPKELPSYSELVQKAAAKRPQKEVEKKEVEKRNCSRCGNDFTQKGMKKDWEKPAKSRLCNKCKKGEESVRLDGKKYPVRIKSNSQYWNSIPVPDEDEERYCKVDVYVTLKKNESESEDAKQKRARAEVSRKLKKRACYGEVVNVVDCEKLGEYRTRVLVKQDAVNDLYVEKKSVLKALAKTQNGQRQPPKKDHGPFNQDGECYYLPRARELFGVGGYDRVYARELGRLQKEDSDSDSDEDLEDEDEDEDEEDVANELRYARQGTIFNVDPEAFPEATEHIYFRDAVVTAPGRRCKSQFGATPEEATKNVIYQCKVNLLAQLRIPRKELLKKLAEGEVKELEEAGIHVSSDELKSMVEHVRKALDGVPFDADDSVPGWQFRRFESATCAAMGVSLLNFNGVLKYVVRKDKRSKDRRYRYAHTEAGLARALKRALELSPSLRRLYEDAVRAQDLLSVVRKRRRAAAAAAPARRSGGLMKDIFRTWMADINEALQAKGIHIDLVAAGVEITSEASDAIDTRL